MTTYGFLHRAARLLIFMLLLDWQNSTLHADQPQQEFYELRTYKISDIEKQQIVSDYLRDALLPALQRQKLDRIGAFTRTDDENDHSIYVLIPFPDVVTFANLNARLAADKAYQLAAKSYAARPIKDPAFDRIESRFMKAFAGMPRIEQPEYSQEKSERIFELRLYESHTEESAARKVEMFNDGEIDVMRDVKLAPVFYGETLIGPRVPNLIYMLSGKNAEAHKEHWDGFKKHPQWLEMKQDLKYKGTVSKIDNWMLIPTSYSQL